MEGDGDADEGGSRCQEEEEELSPQRQREMSPTKEECVRKTVL